MSNETEVVEAGQVWPVVASGVCSGLTVAGNLLVLLSFKVEKKLRTISNYYIISLAIADLCVGLFSMPIYSVRLLLPYLDIEETYNAWVCYIYLTLDHTLTFVSVVTIIAIGLDRYFCIKYPMKFHAARTGRSTMKWIAGLWVGSWVLMFCVVFVWSFLQNRLTEQEYCHAAYEESIFGSCLLALLYFWIPLPAICLVYVQLYSISARAKRQMKSNAVIEEEEPGGKKKSLTKSASSPEVGTSDKQGASVENALILANENARDDLGGPIKCHLSVDGQYVLRRPSLCAKKKMNEIFEHFHVMSENQNTKALRTFSLIIGALILTWTPWAVLVIIRSAANHSLDQATEHFYQFSYFFTYTNSTLNPLCYALASKLFSDSFARILCCRLSDSRQRKLLAQLNV